MSRSVFVPVDLKLLATQLLTNAGEHEELAMELESILATDKYPLKFDSRERQAYFIRLFSRLKAPLATIQALDDVHNRGSNSMFKREIATIRAIEDALHHSTELQFNEDFAAATTGHERWALILARKKLQRTIQEVRKRGRVLLEIAERSLDEIEASLRLNFEDMASLYNQMQKITQGEAESQIRQRDLLEKATRFAELLEEKERTLQQFHGLSQAGVD